MRWATRAHCHIDRVGCAWLIRRCIDANAEFLFVDDDEAPSADAIPFDMPGADLSHHCGDCSFETILRRYDLTDPLLWEIARIVHEGDLEDERYDVPEAHGISALLRGLGFVHDDQELISVGARLFDGLYEYFRQAALQGGDPS